MLYAKPWRVCPPALMLTFLFLCLHVKEARHSCTSVWCCRLNCATDRLMTGENSDVYRNHRWQSFIFQVLNNTWCVRFIPTRIRVHPFYKCKNCQDFVTTVHNNQTHLNNDGNALLPAVTNWTKHFPLIHLPISHCFTFISSTCSQWRCITECQ